jgi:DNA-binding winged helix-turn-helix (wHTH) protein/tetratricopeptide (TPR) repeat protein
LKEQSLIRFEGFELDPATRVVKRGGLPLQLNPKTFDLLLFLAEHPHQLVTKERLLSAVWPDSFVEESNLSQHVFLLRKALTAAGHGDQIVVTIPGKGYQFSAAVQQVPRPALGQAKGELLLHAVQSVTRVVVEEETDDELPPLQASPGTHSRRSAWLWTATASAFVLVAAGLFLTWSRLHPASPAEHIDLVLSEFENTTGDADFDHVLNRALAIDLEQSPFLNLISRSKIRETLAQMQRQGDEPLAPALALEICERNNAQAMLHGSISKFGSRYLLMLNADSCVSGKQMAGYKAEATTKEEVLSALDAAAARVRKQLGESATSLEQFQTPIRQATTPSLDALRAYSQASEQFDQGDMKAAQSLAERAIALDPNFATAYRCLSIAHYNRGDSVQAATLIRKAFDLRDRTTERERLAIEVFYYAVGVHDYEAAVRSLKLFNQIYPNVATNWTNLCSMYNLLGEYPEAIDAGEHAYRIDPHARVTALVLSRAYKRDNRFADARRVAGATVAERKDPWGAHSILLQVAYAEHDAAKIKSETEWGLAHQNADGSLNDLAYAAATSGKLREAIDEFSRARDAALHDGDTDLADSTLTDMANVQIELGKPAAAAETLRRMKGDAGDPGTRAYLKAETGDLALAQRFVADNTATIEKKDTVVLYCELPLVRALLALKAHKPAEAVQLLEPARPYQMRDFSIPWLRAQAEAEAGMLDAAAGDYRLILSNQGVDPIAPLYPLSHLGLARVLALQKRTDSARDEYRAFLAAWKDADPELKILSDARSELTHLK